MTDKLYYDKRGKYRPKPFLKPALDRLPVVEGESVNCPLCGELIYNSGASWRGHFAVSHRD